MKVIIDIDDLKEVSGNAVCTCDDDDDPCGDCVISDHCGICVDD